ncbi:MAG TPA: polyprenyl synthetase family protein [Actinomycetota bacterium]|nr:polyprenyl synthetase family protein [Actinomycetota bacterium]
MAVRPDLEWLRREFDATIESFLTERGRRLPEASDLIAEIRRVVAAGGKRLRPAFCYWGCRAAGGAHGDDIVRLASSFELLHTFAIVHDDIMDAAPQRRGQDSTVARLGVSQALLVGDLALVLADAAFWSAAFPPEVLASAFEDFTMMREEVIAGQHLDVIATGRDIDQDHARLIARLKSGSYSIEHPLLIGARLAGAPAVLVDGLRRAGRPLGEAFQLRDDLLGLFGDPATTGKPADSDIREGKRHLPYALTVARLRGDEREWFVRSWGRGPDLTLAEVDSLRALVESSGARAETEALTADLAAQAAAALEPLDIAPDAQEALRELIDAAVVRVR